MNTQNTELFDTAVMGTHPAQKLLEKTRARVAALDWTALTQIDGLLAGILVKALRHGDLTRLNELGDALNSFLDSNEAETMEEHTQGHDLLRRWEMLFDMVYMAEENYDPLLVAQAIEARAKGSALMNVLYRYQEGIRAKDLARELSISPQNLSKLLRYFEEKGLVERIRSPKLTLVRLSVLGRVHMLEVQEFKPVAAPKQAPALHPEVNHLLRATGGYPRNLLDLNCMSLAT